MNLKLTCGCGLVTEINQPETNAHSITTLEESHRYATLMADAYFKECDYIKQQTMHSSELKVVKEQRDKVIKQIAEIEQLLDGKLENQPGYRLTRRINNILIEMRALEQQIVKLKNQ